MINLYNFMDGIDGLAGMRHCGVAASAACFYFGAASRMGARCLGTRGRKRRLSSLELAACEDLHGDCRKRLSWICFRVFTISSAIKRPWMLWPGRSCSLFSLLNSTVNIAGFVGESSAVV